MPFDWFRICDEVPVRVMLAAFVTMLLVLEFGVESCKVPVTLYVPLVSVPVVALKLLNPPDEPVICSVEPASTVSVPWF